MSSKGEEEIDIDDPDFWQKWAKKAELDVDLMNKVCRLYSWPQMFKGWITLSTGKRGLFY